MFLLAKLMEGTADAFTLLFYRSLVQIAISLTAIIKNGEHPLGQAGELTRFWLLVRGGFGAGAVIAWFFGIQNLPLPDAVTLQFTTPPFAAVFAVCLVGEKWLRLDMIGAAVCLAGVALIAHPTWLFGQHGVEEVDTGEDPMMKAFAVGVTEAGAAMAGIAYVSVRLIGDRASANVMVLYYGCLSIPIVLLGSRWLLGKWSVWGDDFFSPWDYLVSIGLQLFAANVAPRGKLMSRLSWSDVNYADATHDRYCGIWRPILHQPRFTKRNSCNGEFMLDWRCRFLRLRFVV